MPEMPPKWVMEKYAKLWVKFKDKPFNSVQAKKIMGDLKNPSIFYSELKKHGWLTIQLDPKDSRKSIYTLKNPQKTIEEIGQNTKD